MRFFDLHCQKYLREIVDILPSSKLKEVVERVTRNDEMWLLFPHSLKFEYVVRFPKVSRQSPAVNIGPSGDVVYYEVSEC